jgi:hypothetical protein
MVVKMTAPKLTDSAARGSVVEKLSQSDRWHDTRGANQQTMPRCRSGTEPTPEHAPVQYRRIRQQWNPIMAPIQFAQDRNPFGQKSGTSCSWS